METSLTPGALLALTGAMALLAAVPGVSVAAVLARSAAGGLRHGLAATAGIAAADAVSAPGVRLVSMDQPEIGCGTPPQPWPATAWRGSE